MNHLVAAAGPDITSFRHAVDSSQQIHARAHLAPARLTRHRRHRDIRVTTDIDPETGQQLKNGEPVVDADGAPVMYDKAGKDVRAMSTIGVKGEPGPLDINLGRVPLVITPDGAIGQRAAINAYLADVCGLNGANPLERATIVAIDEALREMKAAWDNMPSGGETDEEKVASAAEKLATWFAESAAKDYCGPSDMSGTRGERRAMWFMKRLYVSPNCLRTRRCLPHCAHLLPYSVPFDTVQRDIPR